MMKKEFYEINNKLESINKKLNLIILELDKKIKELEDTKRSLALEKEKNKVLNHNLEQIKKGYHKLEINFSEFKSQYENN